MVEKDELMFRFASGMRRARALADMNQSQLASKIGLTRASISNIEKCKQGVPLHTAAQIADALGCTVSGLIGESPLECAAGDPYTPGAKVVTTVHPEVMRRLETLASSGIHGVGVSGVAQRMLEDGVRRAASEGWLQDKGKS